MKSVENSYALASSVRDLNCRGIHLRWSFSLSLFDQRGSSAESAWVILGIDNCLRVVLYVGMPRKLRIEYSGAMYHVMSRGDRREKIYLDDVDRQDFIKTLAEA